MVKEDIPYLHGHRSVFFWCLIFALLSTYSTCFWFGTWRLQHSPNVSNLPPSWTKLLMTLLRDQVSSRAQHHSLPRWSQGSDSCLPRPFGWQLDMTTCYISKSLCGCGVRMLHKQFCASIRLKRGEVVAVLEPSCQVQKAVRVSVA